jgi:hypothetical protein
MGYFMVWFHSRYGLLLLIVLPTLLLGMSELWRLWRPHGKHEPGATGRPRTTPDPAEPHRPAERTERPGSSAPRKRRRRLPDEAVA